MVVTQPTWRSEAPCGKGTLKVRPGINIGVDVAGLSPILGVVVAQADTEGAQDGTKLAHTVGLTTILDEYLRETTAKFTTITLRLSSTPALEGGTLFVVHLTGVVKHLAKRISTTEASEVLPLDGLVKDSLVAGGSGSLLGSGGSTLGRLCSWCA